MYPTQGATNILWRSTNYRSSSSNSRSSSNNNDGGGAGDDDDDDDIDIDDNNQQLLLSLLQLLFVCCNQKKNGSLIYLFFILISLPSRHLTSLQEWRQTLCVILAHVYHLATQPLGGRCGVWLVRCIKMTDELVGQLKSMR